MGNSGSKSRQTMGLWEFKLQSNDKTPILPMESNRICFEIICLKVALGVCVFTKYFIKTNFIIYTNVFIKMFWYIMYSPNLFTNKKLNKKLNKNYIKNKFYTNSYKTHQHNIKQYGYKHIFTTYYL